MNSVNNVPIEITTGDTESITLVFQNFDKTPINISGRTYNGQLRSTPDSDTIIASFVCSIVGDGSTGEVVCTIPANVTANLQPQVCVYDLQETNGATVTTLLRGDVKIIRDVTR